jgi:hypothetical protein
MHRLLPGLLQRQPEHAIAAIRFSRIAAYLSLRHHACCTRDVGEVAFDPSPAGSILLKLMNAGSNVLLILQRPKNMHGPIPAGSFHFELSPEGNCTSMVSLRRQVIQPGLQRN